MNLRLRDGVSVYFAPSLETYSKSFILFFFQDSISAVIAKYSSNGYMDILMEKWYGGLACFKLNPDYGIQPRPLDPALDSDLKSTLNSEFCFNKDIVCDFAMFTQGLGRLDISIAQRPFVGLTWNFYWGRSVNWRTYGDTHDLISDRGLGSEALYANQCDLRNVETLRNLMRQARCKHNTHNILLLSTKVGHIFGNKRAVRIKTTVSGAGTIGLLRKLTAKPDSPQYTTYNLVYGTINTRVQAMHLAFKKHQRQSHFG
ncbi:hypothetical protein EVAR_11384_1 [Eumeta japonica]|uniref:Uncharacterized protein n=1 Tax=Eumeta variegata TaxID=151549 RepID=A0A4C1TLY4_EUMVA|nr:hypothetical protein EVAR_11384_1 [Eumeta japonica]